MASRLRVVVLALSAGCVDAVGFLLLFGVFTAHLSGDTTHLAVDLGRGDFGTDALARTAVLVVFVLGVVVGVAVVASSAQRGRALLVVEIASVVTLLVVGTIARDEGSLRYGSGLFYVLVTLAALAMGLQSAYLRGVSGASVHTTFITGMLTALAEDGVAYYRDRGDRDARNRIALHGTIWLGYLVGGIVGAALALELHFWALVVPIVLLLVVLAGAGFPRTPHARIPSSAPRGH
jgi:uncharacterized membrane protein YoaK (UPF0700 family)